MVLEASMKWSLVVLKEIELALQTHNLSEKLES